MTRSPTALDIPRRGFLGMLLGAAAAVVAAPLIETVDTGSLWGSAVRTLRKVAPKSRNPVTLAVNRIEPATMADAFAQVERWNLPVQKVYIHPDTYKQLEALMDGRGEEPTLWGAVVQATTDVERGEAFVVNSMSDPRGVANIQVLS